MRVSEFIQTLKPYQPGKPISETKRELGLKEVIKLASNESPIGPSAKVLAAMRAALFEVNRYPDGSCFAMREAFAKAYSVAPEQLVFGNGSDEIVDRLVQVYCEPGDAILTSQGAFVAYQISAQSSRVHSVFTPLRSDYRFDLSKMAEDLAKDHAVGGKVRLVFLPNPNNPTGTYFTQSEFDQFMRMAEKLDVYVVLDEAYSEFVRAKDFPHGLSNRQRYKNLLLLQTLSKVYGLAGVRVGVMVAPQEVCGFINRVRKPFNVNSIAQAASVAALDDKEHLHKVQELTWAGLDYFTEELTKMGLEFCPSQGNFVFFNSGRDGQSVFQEMLKRGVILRPVGGYGFPRHLRMSVGLESENRAAIQALRVVLK